jgi:hypothetical protein
MKIRWILLALVLSTSCTPVRNHLIEVRVESPDPQALPEVDSLGALPDTSGAVIVQGRAPLRLMITSALDDTLHVVIVPMLGDARNVFFDDYLRVTSNRPTRYAIPSRRLKGGRLPPGFYYLWLVGRNRPGLPTIDPSPLGQFTSITLHVIQN